MKEVYEVWKNILVRSLARWEAEIDFGDDEFDNIPDDVSQRVVTDVKAMGLEMKARLEDGMYRTLSYNVHLPFSHAC
jgi:hypothetical protein